MLTNKRQLSEILGVSERSLTEWQKEGLPVVGYADNRGQANEYDTADVIRWLIQREISRLQLEKPRDRLDRLKADKIELEIKQSMGELAPAALFERAWADHILAARTEFLALPDILAGELSAVSGVAIDADTIAAHINRALEKLSHYGDDDDADPAEHGADDDGADG